MLLRGKKNKVQLLIYMIIIVKDNDGKVIDSIPTSPMSLNNTIEDTKQKYPPEKGYHAELKFYD